MATIKVNWFYLEMVGTFNAIEQMILMYKENQNTIREKMITAISEYIRNSKTIANPEEAIQAEIKRIDYHFKKTYPRIQAYSALIITYSAVEHWLDQLGEHIKSDRKLPVCLRDFRGTLTERSNKFAKTFGLVDLSSKNSNLIEKLRLLRNCIVHAEGHVKYSKAPSKLTKLVQQEEGIDIDENGVLSISIDKAIELVDYTGKSVASIFKSWNYDVGIK